MELAPGAGWRRPTIELFLLTESAVGEDYPRWLNDPRVNRFLESRHVSHSLESTREFVRCCLASPSVLFLGIRSLELGGRHVGNIKLGPIDQCHGLGEIGLMLGEPGAWGRGIGSEAIAALCDISGSQLGLRKITAGCYASNVGSRKAFIKAGFDVEGQRRAHFILDGHPEDLVLMARWLR
jgi:ribosomal-protein-alanine N-acetyltransferase